MTSHLLTSIIAQLSTLPSPFSSPQTTTTTTNDQTSKSKNLLLTLHCLFPDDLLLALDIIDRQLIRRYQNSKHDNNDREEDMLFDEVFFVASTSPASKHQATKTYEVRLNAWNCSCPAFTMRAFQPVPHSAGDEVETGENAWFGGTLVVQQQQHEQPNNALVVCKHLLACVLAAKCATVFGHGIGEERVIEREELAGLCAGFAG